MHKLRGSTTGRLVIGGIVIAAPLVLAPAGCVIRRALSALSRRD